MPAALDANKFPTLLDVAKLDKGSGYDVIQEAIFSHAEVDLFPAATQSDCQLEVTVMTELPDGSTFRQPNTGIQPTKAKFANKKFDMALVNRRVEVDKVGVYGRSKNKPRLLINQSVPQMAKALSDVSKQIIYGALGDKNSGFPGLVAQAANDAAHAVDAAGTTNLTSIWLLDIRPSSMELVFGADETLTMSDDWEEETTFIPPNNDRLKVLYNEIAGWVGFRLLNINRAIQIKNIGTANGKTLTPLMVTQALNLCQDNLGFTPTHILGNGRSFEQYRQALVTELLPNPDRITEIDGIPVVRSINVSTSEAAR